MLIMPRGLGAGHLRRQPETDADTGSQTRPGAPSALRRRQRQRRGAPMAA